MSEGTNWSTFTWRVVQRFKSREAFRDIVAHYAITQGTNLCFANSNKKKLLRLEAKCLLVVHLEFMAHGTREGHASL